jgi:hypothetical protein
MVANPDTLAVRQTQLVPSRLRVPPNLFGIAFGLAGLGEAWNAGRQAGRRSACPARFPMRSSCWRPRRGSS